MNTATIKNSFVLAVAFVATLLIQLALTTPAHAATITWNGGGADTNISTTANWVGGVAPGDGDDLVFPANAGVVTNDSLTTVASITIQDGASGVVSLNSNALSITGPISVGTDQLLVVNLDLTLGADVLVTLTNLNSSFTINTTSTLDLNGNNITFDFTGKGALDKNSSPTVMPMVSVDGLLVGAAGTQAIVNGATLNFVLTSANPGFDGDLVLDTAQLRFSDVTQLGSTTGSISLTNSQLSMTNVAADINIAKDVTFNGNFFGDTSSGVAGQVALEFFGDFNLEFSGNVTLATDLLFSVSGSSSINPTLTFSGPTFAGAYLIGFDNAAFNISSVVVTSVANTTRMPNGTYTVVSSSTTPAFTTDDASENLLISIVGKAIVNGTRGDVFVSPFGWLYGSGTVGDVTVLTQGEVHPGESPGCLATGNISFVSGSSLNMELDGTTVCTEYDRLNVTGTVDLGGATLNIQRGIGYTPSSGAVFIIISNDGADVITDTFAGLVEGATTTVDGVEYTISYVGGDGNDVTLTAGATTVASTPEAPDTGFGSVASNYIFVALATVALAGGITFAARKFQKQNA